jgi:hypothetical protein
MNAVKRCLALFAATLVVGACSGDPTAGDAGADLSIRATPGAVWVRNNASASVIIEAIDKLGGPAEGSWTAGTPAGPFTIAIDPTYRPSSTGAIGTATKFIVTPTAEGEGSVTITGTGGSILVPIRIAPDTNLFAVTFSSLTPALGDTVSLTAPAGTRFTAGSTVNFYNGPLTTDLQQGAAPKVTTIVAPDSTVLFFVPPSGAEGKARITGISNVATPSLTVTARSASSMATVGFKTLAATYSTGPTGIPVNSSVTVTLTQPSFRFRTGAGGAADTTAINAPFPGSTMAGVLAAMIDSTHIQVFLPPGFRSRLTMTKLFHPSQGFFNLSLPGTDSLFVDSLPTAGLGGDDPFSGPAIGSVTLPAMGVGETRVFWDNGTFASTDVFGIGHANGLDKAQAIRVIVTTAGTYRFRVAYDGSATAPDIDAYLLDGAFDFIADCGSCGANPEVLTAAVGAGSTNYIALVIWAGNKPARMRVTVVRTA